MQTPVDMQDTEEFKIWQKWQEYQKFKAMMQSNKEESANKENQVNGSSSHAKLKVRKTPMETKCIFDKDVNDIDTKPQRQVVERQVLKAKD
jgi:hypothetical protein